MKVFLGWSGDRSKKTANALHEWLPNVIQAVDPFISSGIPKGKRWGEALAGELETTKVGILCLTSDNLDSKWILYEAGALSNAKDTQVCTFLLDVKPTDVKEPLATFQHTMFQKDDIRKLLKTINDTVEISGERALSESRLDEAFETYWPKLEEPLNEIVAQQSKDSGNNSGDIRSDREILEEILEIVRRIWAEV